VPGEAACGSPHPRSHALISPVCAYIYFLARIAADRPIASRRRGAAPRQGLSVSIPRARHNLAPIENVTPDVVVGESDLNTSSTLPPACQRPVPRRTSRAPPHPCPALPAHAHHDIEYEGRAAPYSNTHLPLGVRALCTLPTHSLAIALRQVLICTSVQTRAAFETCATTIRGVQKRSLIQTRSLLTLTPL
jgi:hypothetical protein